MGTTLRDGEGAAALKWLASARRTGEHGVMAAVTEEPNGDNRPIARGHVSGARTPPLVRKRDVILGLPSILRADPLSFLQEAREKYGDIYTLDLGFLKAILVNHPKHAQLIFRDRAANYGKGGPFWEMLRTVLGNSLPVSEGDYWRRQRRMIQPHFNRERIANMVEQMAGAIGEGMANWDAAASSSRAVNLADEFGHVTLNVIVRTMFGTSIDRSDSDEISARVRDIHNHLQMGVLLHYAPRWLPTPGKARHQENIAAIDKIFFRLIERRREESGDDMISMLLNMVDTETLERMTDKQIRDEAISIFLAGHDTTTAALTWSVYYLLRYPEVARAMQAEVDSVLQGRAPTSSDLSKLRYTLAVFQESLRLRPITFWLPRQAIAEDTIDGWTIPKGAIVAPVLYTIHRHPECWAEPERFEPERFTTASSTDRHGLSWLPFGAGQHYCIGRDFAQTEATLVLAMLAQRYVLAPVPGREARVHASTLLRTKDGVWAYLRKRRPAEAPPQDP